MRGHWDSLNNSLHLFRPVNKNGGLREISPLSRGVQTPPSRTQPQTLCISKDKVTQRCVTQILNVLLHLKKLGYRESTLKAMGRKLRTICARASGAIKVSNELSAMINRLPKTSSYVFRYNETSKLKDFSARGSLF